MTSLDYRHHLDRHSYGDDGVEDSLDHDLDELDDYEDEDDPLRQEWNDYLRHLDHDNLHLIREEPEEERQERVAWEAIARLEAAEHRRLSRQADTHA